MRPALAWAVLGLGIACRPAQVSTPAGSDVPAALPPSRLVQGEIVEANVPLQQGGVVGLAELRGRLVVLELVDAAHRDAAIESDYAALASGGAESVAVVMVSLDADGWGVDVPPFVLGWDPQGALAARLRVASVPTVMLIDREGRVLTQYSGTREPGHRALMDAARRAQGTSAAAASR